MTQRQKADVIVIGMGPGGEEVANRLVQAGLKVIGIEQELVGGECPYWGCVPSKMMIRAADLLAEARRIRGMAGDSAVLASWDPVARRIRAEATDNWNDKVAVDRFVTMGGHFIRGHARLVGPRLVGVADQQIEAHRGVVLATGSAAAIPPVPGLAELSYWTNREAIETEEVPDSLVVLGGGAVGAELAQVFARFGAQVRIVEAGTRLLPMEEPEASEAVGRAFAADGITVRTGVQAISAEQHGASLLLRLSDGSQVSGHNVLVATGRKADLAALGLGTVGVDARQSWVPVDGHMRAADGLWAVGDLTGKGAFTHVAIYQAAIAASDILGEETRQADYTALPRVTFTDPEVGSVGMTAHTAREAGIRVRTGAASISSSTRGWIHNAGNEGVIKLVEDADRGVLVGATSAGPAGGEVLGLLSLAVHARVPTDQLRTMMYAYPTFHRAIETALADL
jgi:pyruvate/2-oxoglutarate dehydrogenase complex dihydrolipoamide dehydrogenase (E3) component